MESIWLKLTARFPALVLCTESVWFWSSKRFAERAALGNFYLSFGLQGEKIVLDTASAKHCEMAHIGWNQQPAPQLLCYVQSQCGSEVPNNLLKGPPLATFICPLVYKTRKLSLIKILQKVVRWNPFGWNWRLASQLLCYVQSQCGSEVPNDLLKGPPLATFICPLVVLDTAPAKHCIGWNRWLAPQFLCYVQSQWGSEVL